MRRLTVAVLAATTLLSTSCSSDITSAALQSSVGTAFQRIYVLQQHELGRDEPVTPDAGAQCLRSGSAARTGAGTWTCTVHFPYADGHLVPLSFDVEVQPIGCYVASGPPAIVGGLTLTTPAGASVTNPLYAFDGCFDPQ